MKTMISLKTHITKLCSLTFPLHNYLFLRNPFFRSGDKKSMIEFNESKIYARTYMILLSIALLLLEYAGLKYLTKFLAVRVNNTNVL